MRLFILLICLVFSQLIYGQSTTIPLNRESYHIVDRLEILNGHSDIHTSVKGFRRDAVNDFVTGLKNSNSSLSNLDVLDIQYILDDSNEYSSGEDRSSAETGEYKKKYVDSLFYTVEETKSNSTVNNSGIIERKPFLKHFFKTPANFYELNNDFLKLRVNPVLNIKFGADLESSDNENSEGFVYQNTRGIEVRGLIDDKVYFYTNIHENQGRFNDFINERIGQFDAIPGFGNFKNFPSSVSDRFNGFDFPNSQAYVGVNVSKHVGIELGHGRHFIGNGYNSLLLSDYANNYFYLKFSTKVWKLHYQNIFAELAPISTITNQGDVLLPKKYMATHYLSFKPRKNIEIGLFETVIFARPNQFEFQYLNPVILYRTVEFFLDSPDNVLIGLNGNWNFLNRFSLYGQLILDEFLLSELTGGSGWWANKYGTQLGLKYVNVAGIDHLDAQVEYNVVRPYTYGQRRELEGFPDFSVSNYSHFAQPLAHPLGANFREAVFILRYKPIKNLNIQGRFMYASYGDSVDGDHWGNNILRPNNQRVQDFGNEIGQGVGTTVTQLGLDVSYSFFHNYSVDFQVLLRNKGSELNEFDLKTSYFGGGIRANISNLKIDY
jgi:hypothetical protein